MQRVYNFLYHIKEQPIAFLGKKNLERLEFSLAGYIYAVHECEGISLNAFQNKFNEFVAKKYHVNSSHNCGSIIRFYNCGEEEAFDAFYELLAEFTNQTQGDGSSVLD